MNRPTRAETENTVMPRLHSPFPPQCHPDLAPAAESNLAWARASGLLTSPAAVSRFTALQPALLAAGAYVAVDRDALMLAADWCSWLFLFDDLHPASERRCPGRGPGSGSSRPRGILVARSAHTKACASELSEEHTIVRVLFAGPGQAGHLFPMIPTAQALRSAGHDVLFAALPPVDLLRTAGLPMVEVGDGSTLMEAFRQTSDATVYVDEGQSREERLRIAVRGFARHGRTAVPGLLRLAEAWRPDVLVHDAFHAGAPLVAAALRIPAVVHNFGVISGLAVTGLVAAELADDYQAHGVTAPPDRTVLDVVPASLGGDGTGWRVRYVPFNGAGVVPAELAGGGGGERRRVAVTLGTVLTDLDGVRSIARLIEHAAAVDAEFLLAIGDADLAPLGTLPPNVRPLPWVPLAQLLDGSDAVVHHGGAGTMMTAAAVGTPQLILPQGADHFDNAAAAEASGFALRATADAVDSHLLDALLNDDGLRKAATAMRAEIAALPSPAALVPAFEDLAATR